MVRLKDGTGLTPKQKQFALEYLKDSNATQAAIRAGYSKKTAGQQGERLLKKVEIATFVLANQKTLASEIKVDATWVVGKWVELIDMCMSRDKPDSYGANKALENLGKYLGMITDKIKHEGIPESSLHLTQIINTIKDKSDEELKAVVGTSAERLERIIGNGR